MTPPTMPHAVVSAPAPAPSRPVARALEPPARLGPLVQEVGCCLLLVMLPFSKAVIEITFFVLLGGWLLEHAPTRWQRSVWRQQASWVGVALIGYLAVCAGSILVSTHVELSVAGFVRKTLEYALWFVIAADVIHLPRLRATWIPMLIVSGWLLVIDITWQEVFGRSLAFQRALWLPHRVTGPYDNPIDFATYLLVAIPLLVAWWCEAGRTGRLVAGALVLCLVRAFINSEAQGAWLGAVVAGVVLILAGRRFRAMLALGAAAVGGLAAALLFMSGRLEAALTIVDTGANDRLFMWRAAWRMIEARPWSGHGLNTFMANYLTYWVGGEWAPRYAHNCYLQMWAETGILGLGLFLMFLGSMTVFCVRALRRQGDPASATILAGMLAALAGFVVHAAFDTNFYSLRQATLFWVLAGFAVGLAADRLQPARTAPQP